MKVLVQKFLPQGPFTVAEENAVKRAEPQSTDEFALVKDLGDLEYDASSGTPTLNAGESQVWKDTDTNKYYFIFSPDGTVYLGVELGVFTP